MFPARGVFLEGGSIIIVIIGLYRRILYVLIEFDIGLY